MTTDDFLTDKRNAVRAYVRELTGERVGPCGVDAVIVPYLFELNAIPGVYSWASCAGHSNSYGYVWVRTDRYPFEIPKSIGSRVRIVHPFQDDRHKIAFAFEGGTHVGADMVLVLDYLWTLAR